MDPFQNLDLFSATFSILRQIQGAMTFCKVAPLGPRKVGTFSPSPSAVWWPRWSTFFLAYTLTFYLAPISTYFLACILALFMAFYLTFSLASGWGPAMRRGPAVPAEIWRSPLRPPNAHRDLELAVAVDVLVVPTTPGARGWSPECPLYSGVRSWGPAVLTAIWNSRLGFGSAELVVGRRRRRRRGRRRRGRKRGEKGARGPAPGRWGTTLLRHGLGPGVAHCIRSSLYRDCPVHRHDELAEGEGTEEAEMTTRNRSRLEKNNRRNKRRRNCTFAK